MKKSTIAFLVIAVVIMSVVVAGVAMAKKNKCTTIQDRVLTYSTSDEIIPLGYDKWGYNYQAHMFNGLYHNAGRPIIPWTKEALEAAGKSTTWLIMKWSDEWMANTDCNNDGKLDRGYSCDPVNAGSSGCPGAWETNHQFGEYTLEDGTICKWNYFVKIVAVDTNYGYKAIDPEDSVWYWYTIEGDEKIGTVIWGAYAKILQISNDTCADEHGVLNNFEAPTGFGYYNQ